MAKTTKKRRGAQAAGKEPLDLPVRLGQIIEVEITGLSHEGAGVGRVEGYTLFVPKALPQEKVRARVEHVKKNFGFAELLEVVEKSPSRALPPCPIYDRCGGCSLQHLAYEEQLIHKQQIVKDNLRRIGGFKVEGEEAVIVHPTLGMSDPWRYRNKAQVPIGEQDGGLVGGFYAEKSHEIIDMNECLIQHPANDEAVNAVKEIASQLNITPYDEKNHTGLLRHVVVKVGARTGEVMVVLVTTEAFIPQRDKLVEEIRTRLSGVKSIVHNINPARTNVIFGEKTVTLWGSDVIYDYIGPIKFAISARSFYQVNPAQTEVLYNKTLEYAGATGTETVIDAYCGIGTISLFLAQKSRHVYGVEIVPEAIADANRNAKLNGIENVTFETGPAEVVIPAWKEQGIRPDVIVVDPPRKGCDEALLTTILQMKPQRVVYVSCNPSTLARDLKVLAELYEVREVQPVDMFPHTGHVECVIGMQRIDT
ncbi:23S rRNA (uracil(1939)-C(5))-methyltransferase RlmD [Brevibacillus ruminantium]|uniref:23S rRNA (Uracil(1939)-C(5))-methyltransferase RlmD n=1 Tax=Brevibacillus ruminantium TaxID=2950604 RepID=A0ABY4WSB8_9BACL|nr:23S rRNA (uracil(1939)-C(5))-methyltransferase RlmD [Brevibacillus ruminantium]USG68329.1 23S rRNA (uracil(1939)-C(5))-methyltransferase RlmD [Brevibacillus ruminantium]